MSVWETAGDNYFAERQSPIFSLHAIPPAYARE